MGYLDHFKNQYRNKELNEDTLLADPLSQFDLWFNEAVNKGSQDANVMVLSTVSELNRPSSRIVLLKEYNVNGFSFFTNYRSKKGKHIEKNPFASLLFPWHQLERQVRIEGRIEKISDNESDAYFKSRPTGSRIGAWTSPQSEEIPSREYLENQESEFKEKYEDDAIPRPENWGGYRLVPDLFEFWQGRENRLHDRFEYKLENNRWGVSRLAP